MPTPSAAHGSSWSSSRSASASTDQSHRVIAADWSGARRGEQHHLWIASWDPEQAKVDSVRSATRAGAVAAFVAAASRDADLLVGLDFNFSFPAWWLEACAVQSPAELWADGDRLEGWLRSVTPPFWGRPGCPRPPLRETEEFRLTERSAPRRPKSVFQVGGAGAVGTASLRGMPALASLRAAGFAVWPFDDHAPGRPLVVEAWPRLAAPTVVKRRAGARADWLAAHAAVLGPGVAEAAAGSEDAFDAVAAALDLAERGRRWHAPLPHPLARREGWISGVDLPALSPVLS